MINEMVLYGLAAIGAAVMGLIVLVGLYVAILAIPFFAERAFHWVGNAAYRLGGGRSDDHEDGEQWPTPPFDRIWIEFRWLAGVAQLAQKKTGTVDWVGNPAERPDMEAFYEARKGRSVDSTATHGET